MDNSIEPITASVKQTAFENLTHLKTQFKQTHLNQLFAEDHERFAKFSVEHEAIVLDFSKHRIDPLVLDGLVDLAQSQDLSSWI
ncbi:MAG TPA: glucose-6-phosphate isomerase, partial [Acinetobacter johnsonii]|nr:glucose-6-phosphate isomerase [Acinetobacter johnsonii]